MDFIDDPKNRVIAAVINDVVKFENAKLLFSDENGAAAKLPDGKVKCAFASPDDFVCYNEKHALTQNTVCVMNMPLGFGADPCVTFAYFEPVPPKLGDVDIRRLAPSLAGVVSERYRNKSGAYGTAEVEKLMREQGVFGAIANGALAGFIGRHSDGHMGMLTVEPKFRRRGIGEALQKFLMTYIMTFGRTPLCDVYADNLASLALQDKLGLTRADGYTFWLTPKEV